MKKEQLTADIIGRRCEVYLFDERLEGVISDVILLTNTITVVHENRRDLITKNWHYKAVRLLKPKVKKPSYKKYYLEPTPTHRDEMERG